MITNAHRRQFVDEGYFILERAICDEHLQILRDSCDRLIELMHEEMDALGTDHIHISHRGKRYHIAKKYDQVSRLSESARLPSIAAEPTPPTKCDGPTSPSIRPSRFISRTPPNRCTWPCRLLRTGRQFTRPHKDDISSFNGKPKVHGNQREQLAEMGEEKFAALLKQHGVSLGCITQYKLGPIGLRDEMKLAQQLGCQTAKPWSPAGAGRWGSRAAN